jgi:putative flippase GtrA
LSARLSPALEHQRVLRFGLVGAANTALGYSVILVVLALGGGDYSSNLAGYAAGLTLSFVLNRSWTFGGRTRLDPATLAKYLATFLVAYLVNLGIVAVARAFGIVDNPLAHLAGIAAYTTIFYVGCRNVVYRDKTASAAPPGNRGSVLRHGETAARPEVDTLGRHPDRGSPGGLAGSGRLQPP